MVPASVKNAITAVVMVEKVFLNIDGYFFNLYAKTGIRECEHLPNRTLTYCAQLKFVWNVANGSSHLRATDPFGRHCN